MAVLIKELATLLHRSEKTVRRWCELGLVAGAYRRRGGSGHWRLRKLTDATIEQTIKRLEQEAAKKNGLIGRTRNRKGWLPSPLYLDRYLNSEPVNRRKAAIDRFLYAGKRKRGAAKSWYDMQQGKDRESLAVTLQIMRLAIDRRRKQRVGFSDWLEDVGRLNFVTAKVPFVTKQTRKLAHSKFGPFVAAVGELRAQSRPFTFLELAKQMNVNVTTVRRRLARLTTKQQKQVRAALFQADKNA
jgi:hypothetical protein